MLQQDLIATPQALWIKILHDRMVLMCHDGSTLAIEYAHSHKISFASTDIIDNFKDAQSILRKIIEQAKLPWYNKKPIIFLQIIEPITPDTPPFIRHSYLKLGAEHARLVRLYNEVGISLDITPLDPITKKKYSIVLMSLVLIILLILLYK